MKQQFILTVTVNLEYSTKVEKGAIKAAVENALILAQPFKPARRPRINRVTFTKVRVNRVDRQ